jgi:hypothetical protein
MGLTFRAWVIAILACAVYIAPLRNGGSSDTFPAQLLPLSILGDGDLAFNEFVCPVDATTGRGLPYDPQRCLRPLPYYLQAHEGRVVSTYPVVAGLLNVPVHVVAQALGVDRGRRRFRLGLITAALISAGAVGAMVLLLGRLGFAPITATLGGLTFAFGTLAWSSSGIGLWQHGPAMLFLLLALHGLLAGERRGLAWAGACLALAVWTRPTNAVLALPLALYALARHPRERLPFLAAAAVPAAAMALYSQWAFGSVLALGQGQQMRFGDAPLEALAGVLVSPARGLFDYSPVLLLALPAVAWAWRERAPHPLLRPLMLGTAGIIAVHALWAVWWGGHSFGYRLLTETLPALVILSALTWERAVRGRAGRVAVAALLLAWSVWANALGAWVAPCGFDTEPDYLDTHPERVWDVRDTELLRCSARVFHAAGLR